jgi:hypothetical protein
MNNSLSARARFLQVLFVLASAASLISCKSSRSSIEVEFVAGNEFTITVNNASEDFLVVDDRLFGLSVESPVHVEVARADGAIIAPCSYLDYVGTGARISVPPDQRLVLSVQLSALTATRCLTPNESYLFRASLVSRDGVVSRAEWIPFRAESLD